MEPIIEIKNLGKKYRINHEKGKYVALRDVIANIFRKPFSFIKDKTKNFVGINTKEDYWALKGVNLEINRGEIVGIIGKNGAGKSTLLKILSQITPPTEGEVTIKGKVGSLLEVGTGFHPELTGRENIFLNGAILGMGKKEISEKFDKIVEFAGIDKFLDTPVKYYSSGMYVRLAFSVAAHMEPDILIVDEVLAVGDAEFQKKCLGKMEEITKGKGRTILFVSHNIGAIERLCSKTILLEKGGVIKFGNTREVIDYYANGRKSLNATLEYKPSAGKEAQITKITILNEDIVPSSQIPINDGFSIDIEYEVYEKIEGAILCLSIFSDGYMLLNSSDADKEAKLQNYNPGKYRTQISIPPSTFNTGYYNIEISIKRPFIDFLDRKQDIQFEILNINNPRSVIFKEYVYGKMALQLEYKTEKINHDKKN
jgi:lipopolysaccharide transport system ATP-binding protein